MRHFQKILNTKSEYIIIITIKGAGESVPKAQLLGGQQKINSQTVSLGETKDQRTPYTVFSSAHVTTYEYRDIFDDNLENSDGMYEAANPKIP